MEINLLDKYPKSTRPIKERGALRALCDQPAEGQGKSDQELYFEQLLLNKVLQLGQEYFDGDRLYGYGGYYYNPKFWTETVQRVARFYHLQGTESLLDVGCAKGFLLHDFKQQFPGMPVAGIDISQYAVEHCIDDMRACVRQGLAEELPYGDRAFDVVLSINTIDHLPLEGCKRAIREIQRVTRQHAYIVVNAWSSEEERLRQKQWNLTSQTCLHVDQWRELFEQVGYTGDYYWFIPS